jgi:hypothetical protein
MGSKRGIYLSFLGKLPFLGSRGQIAKLRAFHLSEQATIPSIDGRHSLPKPNLLFFQLRYDHTITGDYSFIHSKAVKIQLFVIYQAKRLAFPSLRSGKITSK